MQPWVVQGPVPTLSRRSLVQNAAGVDVLLHDATLTRRQRCRFGKKVHVYPDVSGSMEGVLTALYGAILDC